MSRWTVEAIDVSGEGDLEWTLRREGRYIVTFGDGDRAYEILGAVRDADTLHQAQSVIRYLDDLLGGLADLPMRTGRRKWSIAEAEAIHAALAPPVPDTGAESCGCGDDRIPHTVSEHTWDDEP